MSFYVGEALAGDGNEIAHIDLLIGDKSGPVGVAFANALADQKQGHTNLLAVLTPQLAVKPSTIMITKVTIKGARQAMQMFGPAQYAVAKAVADAVKQGAIPRAYIKNGCIIWSLRRIRPRRPFERQLPSIYDATLLAIREARGVTSKGIPTALGETEIIGRREFARRLGAGIASLLASGLLLPRTTVAGVPRGNVRVEFRYKGEIVESMLTTDSDPLVTNWSKLGSLLQWVGSLPEDEIRELVKEIAAAT
jgi:5,6,7,8-tetrahydromethanopterin hydro-lyase